MNKDEKFLCSSKKGAELSNKGLAKWLPQRRVMRRKAVLPSTRQ